MVVELAFFLFDLFIVIFYKFVYGFNYPFDG